MKNYETQYKTIQNEILNTLYSLDNLRRTLSVEEWESFSKSHAKNHYLFKYLMKDPCTKLGFESALHYKKNTSLIDFLYGFEQINVNETDQLGMNVFDFVFNSDPAKAFRFSLKYMAQLIDELAFRSINPISVCSVGSGNVREAELSTAIQQKKIKHFLACDNDQSNNTFTRTKYGHLGIEPKLISIEEFIRNRNEVKFYDLIYAVDVLDYLDTTKAKKLINSLFEQLKKGGYLLFSNFREDISNSLYRTYMEVFMGWFMYYRTDEDFITMFNALNEQSISEFSIITDPTFNINFALIRK